MNVFLRELRAYRKSTIIWTASLSIMITLYMALFPAFTSDVEATRELLSQLPAALRDAMNLSLENFFTIYGWTGYLMSFVVLAGSIQAMNLGVGVISKEFAGKTADFLFTKPVARSRAITAKLAAALTMLLVTNAVFAVVGYSAATAFAPEPVGAKTFLLITSTMLLIQLMFMALGAVFAVTIPRIKSVVSVSLPTVFTFYIVGMLGDVLENPELRYASPFRYYDPLYIIEHAALEGRYLLIEAVFVVLAVAACYVIFAKKNIRASA